MKKIIKSLLIKLGFSKYFSKKFEKRARRYVDPHLTVEEFLKKLNDENISYAVLRWFEILPEVEEGEDLDILVSDQDLEKLERYLTGIRGYGQPCDIYTVSGLAGTSFCGISYYPPEKANAILENTRLVNGLVKAPDPLHHFFSLAYHALYHKGFSSGLPGRDYIPPDKERDHDYPEALEQCARKAGLIIPALTLENLDKLLDEHGWKPPHDTLEKLSAKNRWIREYFFSQLMELDPWWKGFTLFVVREKGLPFLDSIRKEMVDFGFHILDETALHDENRELAYRDIRGGNWSKGPWPASGGKPVYALAVYDCFPVDPDSTLKSQHHGLMNGRIMALKLALRELVNRKISPENRCNIVHSADNAIQGQHYAEIFFGKNFIGSIEEEIKSLYQSFLTPFPVISELSKSAKDAKVEVVSRDNVEVICKIFRPGKEYLIASEKKIRNISGLKSYFPPVLEYGSNYILMEYIKDLLTPKGFFKPFFQKELLFAPDSLRSLGQFLKDCFEKQILPENLSPDKIKVNPEKELIILSMKYRILSTEENKANSAKSRWKTVYQKYWKTHCGISYELLLKSNSLSGMKINQFFYTIGISLFRFVGHSFRFIKRKVLRGK